MARKTDENKSKALSGSVTAAPSVNAVLPLAVGAGIVAHSIYSTRNRILGDRWSGTAASVSSEIAEVSSAVQRRAQGLAFQDLGSRIKDLGTASGWKADEALRKSQISVALRHAMRGMTDEDRAKQILTSVEKFAAGVNTSQEVLNFISGQGLGTSLSTRRVGLRFIQNLQAMQTGMDGTILDANKPFVSIVRKSNMGGPREIGLSALPRSMRAQVLGFARSLQGGKKKGAKLAQSITVLESKRKGFEGSLLHFKFTAPGINEPFMLTIPRDIGTAAGGPATGIVAAGQDLTTKNIVGAKFIKVNSQGQIVGVANSYEEWAMFRARDALVPRIRGASGREEIKREIRRFGRTEVNPALLGETDDILRAKYEYVPSRMGSAGPDAFAPLKGMAKHIATFVDERGRLLKNSEFQGASALLMKMAKEGTISGAGYKVFTKGRAAHGVFVSKDAPSAVRAEAAFPASRQPYQRMRGFTASDEVRELIGRKGSLNRRYAFMLGPAMADDPLRAPAGIQFFSSARHAGLEEGMIYADQRMRDLFKTTTMSSLVLSTQDQKSMNPILESILKANSRVDAGFLGSNQIVPKGTYLGMSPGGSAVIAPHDISIADAAMSQGNLKLTVMSHLNAEDMAKFFGSEKGLAQFVSTQKLGEMTSGVAADFVTAMGNLKKNRSLHYQQMFSALIELNSQNLRAFSEGRLVAGGRRLRAMQSLEKNAADYFAGLEKIVGTDKGFKRAIRNMVARAKAVGLSDRQVGLTFGSLPEVFGIEDAAGLEEFGINKLFAAQVLKKQAIGVGHLFYGGPEELIGAGVSQATIEPRLFTAMSMGQFGNITDDMLRDIGSRSVYSNPEAALASRELTRSLASLSPDIKSAGPGKETPIKLSEFGGFAATPDNPKYLMKTGGFVDFEGFGGLGSIYVPSGEHINELAAFKTPAGKMIQGDLASEYMSFIERAKVMQAQGDTTGFQALHHEFVNTIGKARAASVVGKGGTASGSLMGSRFLKGAIPVSGFQSEDVFKIRMGKTHFDKMQQEMRELAEDMFGRNTVQYKEYLDALALQTKEFMNKKGPGAGGYLLRHPIIGQYSFMPVRFQLDDTIGDKPIIHIPVSEREVLMGGKWKPLNYSIMIGMQGDVDADIYGTILADPRMAGKIAEGSLPGSALAKEYESFSVRAALMKARSLDAGQVDEVAEVVKSIVPSRIGQVSYQMSRVKAALLMMGPGEETLNATFLAEWLEQNPIAGKHLTGEAARNLDDIINDIVRKVDIGATKDLEETISSMVRPGVLEELAKDTTIKMRRKGVEEEIAVKGLNLRNALATIDAALEKFGVYKDKLSGLRARAMAEGKGTFGVEDILTAIAAPEGTPLEGFFPSVAEASSGRTTRRVVQASNELGTYMLKHAKPIGLAMGAALVGAAVLGMPRRTLGPSGTDPRPEPSMGDGVRADTIRPEPSVMGQPTAPRMPVGPAPIARDRGMSAHIRVHGRVRGNVDPNTLSRGVRTHLGPGTNVNTRISDDRSSLTAQNLQDIMDRP